MIAPLIPRLAQVFQVPEQEIGLIVPAYMLAYAIAALFYGLISDRFGRWPVMRASLIGFIVFTLLTATAQTAFQMDDFSNSGCCHNGSHSGFVSGV
jgi:MFS family permease